MIYRSAMLAVWDKIHHCFLRILKLGIVVFSWCFYYLIVYFQLQMLILCYIDCCEWWSDKEFRVAPLEFDGMGKSMRIIVKSRGKRILVKVLISLISERINLIIRNYKCFYCVNRLLWVVKWQRIQSCYFRGRWNGQVYEDYS